MFRRLMMMIAAGGLLLAGCASGPGDRARLGTAETAASFSRLKEMEPSALAAAGGRVERRGDVLVVRPARGPALSFAAKPECKSPKTEGDCVDYALLAEVRSLGVFVVVRMFYEGGEYLLIDEKTGETTTVDDFPQFSPSGRTIATFGNEENGSEETAVQLWSRQGRKWVVAWRGGPIGPHWNYSLVAWRGDHAVQVRADPACCEDHPPAARTVELERTRDGWRVRD
jgi:hypothetical protein